MLSFELTNEGRGILIYCDEDGMTTFVAALERLRSHGDHIHLLTRSNGGRELSEKNPLGKDAIGEVIIDWVGD